MHIATVFICEKIRAQKAENPVRIIYNCLQWRIYSINRQKCKLQPFSSARREFFGLVIRVACSDLCVTQELNMDNDDIYEDIWNLFSQPNNTLYYKRLNGSDLVNACQQLNIELTSTEQDLLSQKLITREEWVEFYADNESIKQAIDKWKKLHSHYQQSIDHDKIKSSTDTLACYQWRLPKYQSSHIDLLCSGFVRNQKINAFIPDDIIGILVYYVFDNMVDRMKISSKGQRFESGIFEYQSCKFNISILPFGYEEYDDDDEDDEEKEPDTSMVIEMVFLDGPKHISHIQMHYTFSFSERFISRDTSAWFSYRGERISLTDGIFRHILDINKYSSLTFNIAISKFTAEDSNNNVIIADNNTPLVSADGDTEDLFLVKPAEDALVSIFNQFATNEDGTMCIEDMERYILYCGAGVNSASRNRIQTIFNYHGNDKVDVISEEETNEVYDRLSSKGFLKFYRAAAIERPAHVWNDFKVFDYGYNLKKDDPENPEYKTPVLLDENICESKNTGVFKWTLSDEDMEKVKTCKPKEIIRSKVFCMHQFKFQIWLFPNGNMESDNSQVVFNMHLLNFPPPILEIHQFLKMLLVIFIYQII